MPEQFVNQFTAEGVSFSMQDHIMLIKVANEFATATITTHGASVLSFIPKGADDLLWVSPMAVYNGEKPIRGGIPICWPWFGGAKQAGLPAHGFVRNTVWHLDHVSNMESGVTEVVLSIDSSQETLKLWPHDFHLELRIEVGEKLAVSLTTTNKSDHDIEITEALHTYFNIKDATGLTISGLENSTQYDTLQTPNAVSKQAVDITLNPPMDSVFVNQSADIHIHDQANHRKILIEKQQALSTVVWNPGSEIVKGFADIPDQAWSDFVCVEAGNVFDNVVVIPAGEKHTMTMMLSHQSG
ncbi:MAG: D-hexose-6-phosphate mutarotase [Pseudomonadota bacterium]|nr:D-hexose-6-phosphate mutarotase [Pseudomonadota bacterium]